MNNVAETIIQQIGGGMFVAMTGAKNFTRIEGGVRFFLPVNDFNRHKITAVEIRLNFMDLYDLEFFKSRQAVEPFRTVEDVYCDQLQDVFEDVTGLLTSLHRRN